MATIKYFNQDTQQWELIPIANPTDAAEAESLAIAMAVAL